MLGLVLIYGMMGFVGREPYKPLEISQIGWFFLSVDQGSIAKAHDFGFDPLLHPIDFAVLFGWMTHLLEPKFIFLLLQMVSWLLLCATLLLTWHAAKRFASLSAAQPVTFAFGGEAKASAYAVAIADSSVLALIAALGFSQFGHEFSPFVFQITCVSGLMMATSVIQGSGLMRLMTRALPLILLAQAGAPLLAMMLCVALVAQSFLTRSAGRREREIMLHFILLLMIAAWLIGIHWDEMRYQLNARHSDELNRVVKLMIWFTWPIWPMAVTNVCCHHSGGFENVDCWLVENKSSQMMTPPPLSAKNSSSASDP